MCVDVKPKRVSLGKIDFALGELKCGRMPWVSGWVWAVVAGIVVGFIAGYSANIYAVHSVVK